MEGAVPSAVELVQSSLDTLVDLTMHLMHYKLHPLSDGVYGLRRPCHSLRNLCFSSRTDFYRDGVLSDEDVAEFWDSTFRFINSFPELEVVRLDLDCRDRSHARYAPRNGFLMEAFPATLRIATFSSRRAQRYGGPTALAVQTWIEKGRWPRLGAITFGGAHVDDEDDVMELRAACSARGIHFEALDR